MIGSQKFIVTNCIKKNCINTMSSSGEDTDEEDEDFDETTGFAAQQANWISDADLMQVFENELGLYISGEWFVTPAIFKSDAEYDELKLRYLQVCKRAGLECAFSDGWTLDTPLSRRFAEQETETSDKILLAEDHLLTRYDQWDSDGHQGALVTVALNHDMKVAYQKDSRAC